VLANQILLKKGSLEWKKTTFETKLTTPKYYSLCLGQLMSK